MLKKRHSHCGHKKMNTKINTGLLYMHFHKTVSFMWAFLVLKVWFVFGVGLWVFPKLETSIRKILRPACIFDKH